MFVYRCHSCPPGYTGSGESCHKIRGCQSNPCHSGVQCHSTHEYPYYRCGECPNGYTGNGTNCQDIDECDLDMEACPAGTECINITPGYRCEPTDWDLPN